ncbi:MAG: HEAT repeat domain-containing protein [Planctomycetota bacterium]
MQNDTHNSVSGPTSDPLDELLRSALWPEESSDRLDDLLRMAQWPEAAVVPPVRPRKGPGKLIYAASAAALLVALALCSLLASGGRLSPDVASTIARNGQPSVSGSVSAPSDLQPAAELPVPAEAVVIRPGAARINPPDLSRVIAPGELRVRMLLARSGPPASSGSEALIHRFLAHRVAQPDGNLNELVEPLLDQRSDVERYLLDCFNSLAGEQEAAAIELLGYVGSEASVPLLLRLRKKPSTHRAAVRALVELADARTLSRLVRSEADPGLRNDIAEALRARADQQTLLFTLATEGELSCRESRLGRWLSSESL